MLSPSPRQAVVAVYLSFFSFCISTPVRSESAIPHSPSRSASFRAQLWIRWQRRLSRTACDQRALVCAVARAAIWFRQPAKDTRTGLSPFPNPNVNKGSIGDRDARLKPCVHVTLCYARPPACKVISDRLPELRELAPLAHLSEDLPTLLEKGCGRHSLLTGPFFTLRSLGAVG